ncbi:hypothetical protein F0562_029777 [Nyssa sinensis]|uniref:Growth-regulating factor n=1 Tax=Nyssa sinensis TaxID=561372 RepID=A0A5J5B0J2_9ASTE|nr:hypothetical protein F0562_029777 [Nyssa sinensis]
MMSGRNRFPFTATQWEELEHQALIFKYMISGMPIPPDLLFTIKRNLDSSFSSKIILHQPQHIGWNCFQMGFGRKIDPEPGRCRRTDGKKWRCSKEAYPDSKYCERHMHRGRNRSRKPVEVMTTSTNSSTTQTPTIPISSITKSSNSSTFTQSNIISHSLSSVASETHNFHQNHPFLYPHSSSSRPPGIGLSSQDHTTHLLLDSAGPYSHSDTDYRNRYGHGMKEEVNDHVFSSEASGTMRSYSGSSMDESWQLTPLTMSSSLTHFKQRTGSGYSYLQIQDRAADTSKQEKQDQHCYAFGGNVKCEMPFKIERDHDEVPQKVMHHFFDEWPPRNKDSWLDSDNKSSNHATASSTQLSISIPNSSHDFFTTHNGK